MLTLATDDPLLASRQFWPFAKAILVWPSGARQPTAIVLARRIFETPLDICNMPSVDVFSLRRMVRTGEYLAVWCNGHVLVTDN